MFQILSPEKKPGKEFKHAHLISLAVLMILQKKKDF
jgi:hypothetical protein